MFFDNFSQSTVGGISTNSGTFTASSTSYDIASGKNATPSTVGTKMVSGHFSLGMASTSAGYIEAQAVFSSYPITLAVPGDSIDVQYVFTDTTNILNGKAGNATSLALGLFNSGGSVPYTNLYNSGLSSGSSTAATGGVQNWLGYRGNLAYGGIGSGAGASANSATYSRPAQNQGNNQNQTLIQTGSGGFPNGVNLGQNANIIAPLAVGSQYTVDYQITLGSDGNLYMTNTLYAGVGTSGAVLATNNATASGANILTTNFNSLVVGGERTGSVITTNDINQLTVTFTSSNQAGPYFVVTGSGGCGAQLIGLSGSVTTNVYWLYTNGVNCGQSVVGTGLAVDFGVQSIAAIYTVVASNTATASQGFMFGGAAITQGAPVFGNAPASVICATNSLATFSASASGNSLSYHWFRNNVQLSDGMDVTGSQTTNLVISPAQTADVGTYYLVVTNPCGYSVTSSPNATLVLEAPYNLVWQGNNPDNSWNLGATANFLNGANPQAFTNGDNVTFNDSSASTSVALVGNILVPTLVNVTGSQNYTLGGGGSMVGSAAVLVNGSTTLTITNANSYTGGTVISNSATLSLGDGTSIGKVTGNIVVNGGATLHYFPGKTTDVTLQNNNVSGTGQIVYDLNGGTHTITLGPTVSNSSFGGTIEIKPGVRLQVTTAYGLGGTNIVVDYDSGTPLSASLYFNNASATNMEPLSIIGRGPASPVDTPQGMGALRLNGTWGGPITIAGVDPTYNVTTIGANGGTAKITGNITDNGNGYELEYYGGTIQVGPATGVNTYGVTRITEQLNNPNVSILTTVMALNSNAFSTNTLNMNGQAILRLNGNNLAFANLIDESATYAQSNFPPIIQNGNTNQPATITVGSDNNSQAFYGLFADGGTQPLGLTKVGVGTLTLSGDSTNTGVVTINGGTLALVQASGTFYSGYSFIGSGSFSNATLISVGSGAVLNVTGRSDGTLTLNANQTLSGNGTVQGNVITLAGSTINPGSSIGTLALANNLTLQGTLMLELNRTNSQKNDLLTVLGTASFGGGTLAVTNIGPALQKDDSFTLFGGARTFGAFNLQTYDYVNNVIYTWNNTVASDGKITVASVTGMVNTNPCPIQWSVTGNTLNLGWPTNRGWTLLTNSVGLTATGQWFPYSGSALLTNVSINMDSTKTNVFFRMVYPYP